MTVSRGSSLSSPARYGAAILCTAAALLLRAALEPVFGARYPFATIYIAILLSARFFGVGPSILVTAAGILGAAYYRGQWPFFRTFDDWVGLVFYLSFSVLAIWLVDRQRREHAAAEENARLAAERLAQLSVEVAQREREERLSAQLRAIVESSEDAIISKSLDGAIQSWNLGAEKIFGYSAAEVVGKPIALLVPPGREHEESDIIERIRHGGRVSHFETVRRRKDGALIDVSLTISPIRDAVGRVAGVSHVARDITDQKQFQEQMRQRQKLESLGVLAGGLAHDFNNLLTGIVGNASLVADTARPDDPIQTRVAEIVRASERASALVREMLAYAGKGRFVVGPVNLSAKVRDVVPLLRPSVRSNVELELRLDDDVPPVDGDASQIQQLIMNLALNAVEAVGEARGTVTISSYARESDSEAQVVLEVKDTGAGMDEATKDKIFDPFFTTKFPGRGLGLAAAIGIVRTHRGTIAVESAPGWGSVFTVVFPASLPKNSAVSEDAAELRGYGAVLVVDDEELVRDMARFTLERCGYTVEIAANGQVGVEKFRARPGEFAAVLLDLTMPVMSGEDALREIHKINPDVPILLSSGYNEAEALRRFQHKNVAGFLQKPYTATALARKMKQALRRASKRI